MKFVKLNDYKPTLSTPDNIFASEILCPDIPLALKQKKNKAYGFSGTKAECRVRPYRDIYFPWHVKEKLRAQDELKRAISYYGNAIARLKKAIEVRDIIWKVYTRTPANDPRKEKLAHQLKKAQMILSYCIDNKNRAYEYKMRCEAKYNFLLMPERIRIYQQKYNENQRIG